MFASISSAKNELEPLTLAKVELEPYASVRDTVARIAMFSLRLALPGCFTTLYHIGSTAIPRIHARPIIDLMAVSQESKSLMECQPAIVNLGYRYWGNHGVVGQRFFTFDDTLRNLRLIHLHCFTEGNVEIERRLAFRNYLRANPDVAHVYDQVRLGCVKQRADAQAYREAKRHWITKMMPIAMSYQEALGKQSVTPRQTTLATAGEGVSLVKPADVPS